MPGSIYVLSDSVLGFLPEATFGDLSSLLGSPATVHALLSPL